ncbi:MAG: 16S rRNA methyltransferase [Roseiflexaceae bacterium]
MTKTDLLDQLVAEVLTSAKYRHVDPVLVQAIGRRELQSHGRLKEAIKETKNKLHQVGAAYLEGRMNYDAWLASLHAAPDAAHQQAICLECMRAHASTRERLPILERFYATIFEQLPPIRHVLDLACGLNPLARPWMPLDPAARYSACDIFADLVAFVGQALPLLGTPTNAWVADLSRAAPLPSDQDVDLTMALKLLLVLEQIERGAAARLLQQLPSRWIVISYPLQSLGGRGKGMREQYQRQFAALATDQPWRIEEFAFPSELVYRIERLPHPA